MATLSWLWNTIARQSKLPTMLSIWDREQANLKKLVDQLKQAKDIKAMRESFRSISEEVGVLAKAFGFGEASPIYELHCPMAFDGQGAIWYQANDEVRNPYYGATMLKCADRIEKVVRDGPAANETTKTVSQKSQLPSFDAVALLSLIWASIILVVTILSIP